MRYGIERNGSLEHGRKISWQRHLVIDAFSPKGMIGFSVMPVVDNVMTRGFKKRVITLSVAGALFSLKLCKGSKNKNLKNVYAR